MKKYDNILSVFLLIFCGGYYVAIRELPEEATKYPFFILALLVLLTITLLVVTFIKNDKSKIRIFEGMQLRQFGFVLVTAVAYVAIINILGFFISTLIYLVVTLLGLKVVPKYAMITSVGFCVVVYLVFVLFLRVPVPKGFIM